MVDKIDAIPGQGPQVRGPERSAKTPAEDSTSARSSQSGGGTDQVRLTEGARLLQRLAEEVEAVPSVDTKRVEAVRQAIQDGTHTVDAGNIADKLLGIDKSG